MPNTKRDRNSRAVIALDLGGTKLASAIFADDGAPVSKRAVPLNGRTGADVGHLVCREVKRLLTAAGRRRARVQAIGIAVPGIANSRTGRVWAPNIPGWDDYPLKSNVQSAVDDASCTVVVESDRSAAILGETWQGAAQGCRDAIFLAVGTGIGAGILINGRVFDGAHGIAGAIGWLALDRPFRDQYSACGCFESHASGEGIAKVAARILARRKAYRGPLRERPRVTAHDVFDAYERGDTIATETLSEAIAFWGMAAANLVSLFNPEKILFGGGVFGPAARFIDDIAGEARRWAQPVAMQHVTFELSQLGSDAVLYGAAYLAIKKSGSVRMR
jgi:glucokinase